MVILVPILVGPPGLLLVDPRPYFGPRAAGCWTSGLAGQVLDPSILLELNPPHFYMVILVPILLYLPI